MTQKQQLVFLSETTFRHGYRFSRTVVYGAPELTPIAEMIANCDKPGWYQTAEIGAAQKLRYEELQRRGATHIVGTMYVPRVAFEWQEYSAENNQYCRGDVELSRKACDVERDFALYRSIKARMARAAKAKRAPQADHPDALAAALKGAKALRAERLAIDEPGLSYPWCETAIVAPAAAPSAEAAAPAAPAESPFYSLT